MILDGERTMKAPVKAGFHMCEYGLTIVSLILWACIVYFIDRDSLFIFDRTTDFGSWIDFYYFATNQSNASQIG